MLFTMKKDVAYYYSHSSLICLTMDSEPPIFPQNQDGC